MLARQPYDSKFYINNYPYSLKLHVLNFLTVSNALSSESVLAVINGY